MDCGLIDHPSGNYQMFYLLNFEGVIGFVVDCIIIAGSPRSNHRKKDGTLWEN